MSSPLTGDVGSDGETHWHEERRAIVVNATGVGLAVAAYGVSFGAISVTGGLTVLQTQFLSAVMFTGGSQFALVGVLIAGGGLASAVATSVMLGFRNAFYALDELILDLELDAAHLDDARRRYRRIIRTQRDAWVAAPTRQSRPEGPEARDADDPAAGDIV